jgi:hypothetical protein
MNRKLMTLGLFVGMAGLVACEPRDEPAFDDDFQFEEAPPAMPAPAPLDTPMDPMMDPARDTLDPMQDTLMDPTQPGTPPPPQP